MADAVLAPVAASALAGVAAAGQRLGRKAGAAGVVIAEVTGLGIASVAARRGQSAALVEKFQAATGLALLGNPKRVSGHDVSVVWSGPDQWLVLSSSAEGRGRAKSLALDLQGLASVTDQGDSRAVFEVSGPHAYEALAKGVMIDLHPRAFAPGDTAVTLVAHIGVQITLLDAAPVFQLMVPRSFSLSFWDWLISSAAEFGVSVVSKG